MWPIDIARFYNIVSRMLWLTEAVTATAALDDCPSSTCDSRLLPADCPPCDEEDPPRRESRVLTSAAAEAGLELEAGLEAAAAPELAAVPVVALAVVPVPVS
jgi:hypothetical protein